MTRVIGKTPWLAAMGAIMFGAGSIAAAELKPEPPRTLRPVVRPTPPAVRGTARNDVDRFILASLEAKNHGLNPEADRATLIRRVCFDLTGLPPTLAEIEAYLADKSLGAYEKMVDRYLASPQYGERWGKHWLDAAGYADSNGYFNADSDRPLAWRYRDYVVRAFNADKPYDRFVKEQLAGDELVGYAPNGDVTPDMVEALAATHFIRNAPDGTGESDGNPDEVRIDRYTVLEGNVQNVMNSLLGITVQCARCHDHKFEPITQKEYYSLQAVLFPVYNPEKWAKPNDRVVAVGTRAELAVIQRRNDLIDRQVKAAQSGLAAFAEPLREQLLDDRLKGLEAPVRESVIAAVKVAKDKRTPAMQMLLKAHAKAVEIRDDELAKRFPEYAALRDRVKQTIAEREKDRPKAPEKIAAFVETDPDPPVHHLLQRGQHNLPGVEVQPGVPAALSTEKNSYRIAPRPNGRVSTGRRLAFANWVTSPENPLFARVMVNRVWQHHFGTGLVATSDNLGASGAKASHPELLDFLAAEFVRSGWSVKALHRLILASATYRQTSTPRDGLDAIDPDNRLLAHFPLRRLDAEEVRDSMLAISGELDLRMGGAFIPSQRTAEGVVEIPETANGAKRRSIYLQQRRTQVVTFLSLFDAPSIVSTCGKRSPSTVPLQSLTLLNSEFARLRAKSFAIRLTRDSANENEKKLDHAFRLVAGRAPLEEERLTCQKFLAAQRMVYAKEKDAEERVWVDLCQMLLASNAFLYVE
jgi:Protein of unknown function (DUF1553)/Protein of unknown function (DUF1549)